MSSPLLPFFQFFFHRWGEREKKKNNNTFILLLLPPFGPPMEASSLVLQPEPLEPSLDEEPPYFFRRIGEAAFDGIGVGVGEPTSASMSPSPSSPSTSARLVHARPTLASVPASGVVAYSSGSRASCFFLFRFFFVFRLRKRESIDFFLSTSIVVVVVFQARFFSSLLLSSSHLDLPPSLFPPPSLPFLRNKRIKPTT